MAEDSIFDLANTLGYESPFGNWLPQSNAVGEAKIVQISIVNRVRPYSWMSAPTKSTGTHFIIPITVRVDVSSPVVRVVISEGTQTKTAFKSLSSSFTYEAAFDVKIPKSFVRIDQSNSSEFDFKVVITDQYSNRESDTKYLKTTIHSNSSITNSKTQTENEHKFNCNYSIKNDFLVGDNVVTSRTDNKVKAGGTLKTPVLAIVLHRTVGSSIAGAISHSKGTHFYVEGGKKGNDGEIFQAMSLKKSSNHIFDTDYRLTHLDVKTANSIGIEVIGLAYYKKNGKIYQNFGEKLELSSPPPLTKAYIDINGRENYWDPLTEAQIKSVVCLVKLLMKEYKIEADMILTHEEIQSKTAGEGQAVKDAIFSYLIEK